VGLRDFPEGAATGNCTAGGSVRVQRCCTSDRDCDDQDPCTVNRCVISQGSETGTCAAPEPKCQDSDPCTLDRCNAASGQCSHEAIPDCCVSDQACLPTGPCERAFCTKPEGSAAGSCGTAKIPGCCLVAGDCPAQAPGDPGYDPCASPACVDGACALVRATADGDADGRPDRCDNCPAARNAGQRDSDADGAGDACDREVCFDAETFGVNALCVHGCGSSGRTNCKTVCEYFGVPYVDPSQCKAAGTVGGVAGSPRCVARYGAGSRSACCRCNPFVPRQAAFGAAATGPGEKQGGERGGKGRGKGRGKRGGKRGRVLA
jgi:hypothetical protein